MPLKSKKFLHPAPNAPALRDDISVLRNKGMLLAPNAIAKVIKTGWLGGTAFIST